MNKSQRIALKPPGALLSPEQKAMKGFLNRKDHQEGGSRNQPHPARDAIPGFDNSLNKLPFNNLLLKRCCRPFMGF